MSAVPYGYDYQVPGQQQRRPVPRMASTVRRQTPGYGGGPLTVPVGQPNINVDLPDVPEPQAPASPMLPGNPPAGGGYFGLQNARSDRQRNRTIQMNAQKQKARADFAAAAPTPSDPTAKAARSAYISEHNNAADDIAGMLPGGDPNRYLNRGLASDANDRSNLLAGGEYEQLASGANVNNANAASVSYQIPGQVRGQQIQNDAGEIQNTYLPGQLQAVTDATRARTDDTKTIYAQNKQLTSQNSNLSNQLTRRDNANTMAARQGGKPAETYYSGAVKQAHASLLALQKNPGTTADQLAQAQAQFQTANGLYRAYLHGTGAIPGDDTTGDANSGQPAAAPATAPPAAQQAAQPTPAPAPPAPQAAAAPTSQPAATGAGAAPARAEGTIGKSKSTGQSFRWTNGQWTPIQ